MIFRTPSRHICPCNKEKMMGSFVNLRFLLAFAVQPQGSYPNDAGGAANPGIAVLGRNDPGTDAGNAVLGNEAGSTVDA